MDDRRLEPVRILDTTLRDGLSTPGVELDLEDRLEIAAAIAAVGVDVVEIGFRRPEEAEAVSRLAGVLGDCVACVLVPARAKAIEIAGEALRGARRPRIHLYLTAAEGRRVGVEGEPREKTLALVREAVHQARSLVPEVQLTPVDGIRLGADALAPIARAALAAGASIFGLPDTAGNARPDTVDTVVRGLFERVPRLSRATVAFHGHDDEGIASTNSLRAVAAGARQVEVTVNGLGPRGGNAALDNVVVALHARGRSLGVRTGVDTGKLPELGRLVARRLEAARDARRRTA